jgi:hypothetical protein
LAWASDCGQHKQFHLLHPYALTWEILHRLDNINITALALCILKGFMCKSVCDNLSFVQLHDSDSCKMQKKVEDFKSSANYCDRMVISYVAQNLFPPSVNNYRASGDDLTARVPQEANMPS